MPRTRQVVMDGCTVTIAALSYDKAMEYFQKGKEMAEAAKGEQAPSADDWANRTLEIVAWSLNRANNNGDSWTVQKVREDLDMLFIRKLHEEIMELTTGEKPKEEKPGEAAATSTGS